MISETDKKDIVDLGFDLETIEQQLVHFKLGFPCLNLLAPASIGNGISKFDDAQIKFYVSKYEKYSGKIVKFVPASGAATRMFKSLYEAKESIEKGEDCASLFERMPEIRQFFERINEFAFYPELSSLMEEVGVVPDSQRPASYAQILSLLLGEKALNYGNLPKGLIKFHTYNDSNRTAAAEHLSEGAAYAKSAGGEVFIHFTVSPQHLALFQAEVASAKSTLSLNNVRFTVDYSIQKQETDTIAVNLDNTPFRDREGKLVFRPAGHGALLENLNEIDGDLIFIKNIDNVVPDSLKEETVIYKKLLAGLLLDIQERIFAILKALDSKETVDDADVKFLFSMVGGDFNAYIKMSAADQNVYLMTYLNRPIRVCGMVKNQGEPGGGPFLALDSEGHTSLQIVESSQIDMNSPEQKQIFKSSTHFNPVDLVCGVKDYCGNKFDLRNFRDPQTGFISTKSKDGKELKAMELPGLWNGAMSRWITLFVEVPIITFNPVKVVNDLLRPEHKQR